MKIAVTFRNAEGETWQKEYVEEKLSKLKKYIDGSVEAHIVLSIEKFRNVAEISLAADGLNINGREEAKDMRLAIDGVLDKIERQLKKRKEKNRGHKGAAARRKPPLERHCSTRRRMRPPPASWKRARWSWSPCRSTTRSCASNRRETPLSFTAMFCRSMSISFSDATTVGWS